MSPHRICSPGMRLWLSWYIMPMTVSSYKCKRNFSDTIKLLMSSFRLIKVTLSRQAWQNRMSPLKVEFSLLLAEGEVRETQSLEGFGRPVLVVKMKWAPLGTRKGPLVAENNFQLTARKQAPQSYNYLDLNSGASWKNLGAGASLGPPGDSPSHWCPADSRACQTSAHRTMSSEMGIVLSQAICGNLPSYNRKLVQRDILYDLRLHKCLTMYQ